MNIENYGKIQEMLIKKGKDAFEKNNPKLETFSSPEADVLINDIEKTPHAFVIACVMDRQIKAEKAWNVPLKLSQRLGTFRFEDLRTLKVEDVLHAMTLPTPIHRFLKEMSRNFCGIYSAPPPALENRRMVFDFLGGGGLDIVTAFRYDRGTSKSLSPEDAI